MKNLIFLLFSISIFAQNNPFLDAGSDVTICINENFQITNASALNINSIIWSTSGDGVFINQNELNTIYLPGPIDIQNLAPIILTISVTGENGETLSDEITLYIMQCEGDILLNGTVSVQNNPIKHLKDPIEPQDAATKSYVDGISKINNLSNFNGLNLYEVWEDNTTINLKPNSFVFVNADVVTLIFPEAPENCCFGDVIYIYLMGKDPIITSSFYFKPNGFPIGLGIGPNFEYTNTGEIYGHFHTPGLKSIVNVGNYWMVSGFEGFINYTSIDNDNDGFSEDEGDCNDLDGAIFPGATEICDSIDNNCDGMVDEDVESIYFEDLDKDGYGNQNSQLTACSQPEGYVNNSIDCVDTNGNIHPNAPEIIDGIDNNCNGIIDEEDANYFTDPRDNNVYKTIEVDGKVWFAEDLRFDSANSHNPFYDDPVPGVYSDVRMYWPDDYEAIPEGWRIPTKDEWVALFGFVGGYKDSSSNAYFYAGGKLKSDNPEDWSSDCLDVKIPGVDEINFNAIAYRYRTLGSGGSDINSTDCNFDGRNQGVEWWSSTANNSFGPNRYWSYYIHLNNNYEGVTYSCSNENSCDKIFEYINESKFGNSSNSEHSGRKMLRLVKE